MQSAKNKYQANKPKVKARGSVAQVMRRPAVKVVDIPKDYKSKINEKLVETMKIGIKGSKKMRKLEEAYELNDLRKMKKEDYVSALVIEPTKSASSSGPQAGPEGTLSTGQSVHQWWASWFKDVEKPVKQLKGKARPAWYDATIVAALGRQKVKYLGLWWEEPTYHVF